jgi:predicted glycoside hydrolase/deacetylase ChbG (UPF0249 family)
MRIVVNADDFGYSSETVEATIECLEAGVVTSASIMPCMPATVAAVEYAIAHPEYSYGVHLTVVGDGAERPVSEPASLPTLVDRTGCLRRTRDVRIDALRGRISLDQAERELSAQIASIRDLGVSLTHVDSHRHLHKFAVFRRALETVLPGFGIQRVRGVQDVYLSRPVTSPTYWLGRRWSRSIRRSFVTTDHFYMPASAGDSGWTSLLHSLPTGRTLEIGVHPGHNEPWRAAEGAGASEFASAALAAGHELIGWGDVPLPTAGP